MKKILLVVGVLVFLVSAVTFFEFQKNKNNCLAEIKNANYEIIVYFTKNSSLGNVKMLQGEISGLPLVKQSDVTTAEDSLQNLIEKHKGEGDTEFVKQVNELGENPLGPVLMVLLSATVSKDDLVNLQKTIDQRAQGLNLTVDRINDNFLNKNNSLDMLSRISFHDFLLSKVTNFRGTLLSSPFAPFLSFTKTKCIMELL